MIVLGIDLGSSSVKVTLFDADKGKNIADVSYPSNEMEIISKYENWAEQDPEVWMHNLKQAILKIKENHKTNLFNTEAIGISYQMHGLVVVDKFGDPVRNSIIWCDSRAVDIGNGAMIDLGEEYCLNNLLNSPGNFTASKLKWVKDNEPHLSKRIHKIMLPGDYIAYKLTNEIRTTKSGISEGVFWDYSANDISTKLLDYYGISRDLIPEVVETFSDQGHLTIEMAELLGLKPGIPVSYRAGDQPNNALSLNVLNPGEVAATAGTSGVVYGITDKKEYDSYSRVNTFLHVNNNEDKQRLGVLLCLNSVGILNSWARQYISNPDVTYEQINIQAKEAPEGSDGLLVLPFGNGAERILENKNIGASIHNLNLIKHNKTHIFRAIQEGIAFAFNYGIEIMKVVGLNPVVIRAGNANMFLSDLFVSTLSNISGSQIELTNTNGAEGAARGAAIGAGFFSDPAEAFRTLTVLKTYTPNNKSNISDTYYKWRSTLKNLLDNNNK